MLTEQEMLLGSYDVVVADPPWQYKAKNKMLAFGKGVKPPYETMKTQDICSLPVSSLCKKDALLFLWTTGTHMPDAIRVMTAWGFEYVNVVFVWVKPKGNLPGYYTNTQCEYVLLGKTGGVKDLVEAFSGMAQVIDEKKTTHSKKPLAFYYNMVEILKPGLRFLELFARNPIVFPDWGNWSTWGNECDVRPTALKHVLGPVREDAFDRTEVSPHHQKKESAEDEAASILVDLKHDVEGFTFMDG